MTLLAYFVGAVLLGAAVTAGLVTLGVIPLNKTTPKPPSNISSDQPNNISNRFSTLIPGTGISISRDQNPVVSNTGVLSLGAAAGDIKLATGLTLDTNTNTLTPRVSLIPPCLIRK